MANWTSDVGIVVYFEMHEYPGWTFQAEVNGKAAYSRVPFTEQTANDTVKALGKMKAVSRAYWRYEYAFSVPVGG